MKSEAFLGRKFVMRMMNRGKGNDFIPRYVAPTHSLSSDRARGRYVVGDFFCGGMRKLWQRMS